MLVHIPQLHVTVCMSVECAFQVVVPLLLCTTTWKLVNCFWCSACVAHSFCLCYPLLALLWLFLAIAANFLIITIILIILAVVATFMPNALQSS